MSHSALLSSVAVATLVLVGTAAQADQVINDDLIVTSSICVGFDCVNGEDFGFDTLRLKENNTRIQFNDTSVGSFPTNNWQIRANANFSGGPNFLGIVDQGPNGTSETGTTVLSIAANAGANALVVNAGGNVGFGNASPVVKLHATNGNTPTLRLEQNGTSGFTPQTWDLAGNEANFFLRDVTNASRLVFRVQPNAPSNSIFTAASGNVGMGTASPNGELHIRRTASGGGAKVVIENTSSTSGPGTGIWELVTRGSDGEFALNDAGVGSTGAEFIFRGPNAVLPNRPGLTLQGAVVATGGFFSNDTTIDPPDYVFAEDYPLLPLTEVAAFIAENRHLPGVPSADDIKADGLNITAMQMALLEKVEELTLYTLEQQKLIEELQQERRAQ